MRLCFEPMPNWPFLVWLAKCQPQSREVVVYSGPWIEKREAWFCEAVWAGDFDQGGFDQTDVVAGTGARVREDRLFFVTSGSTVDRLQWLRTNDGTFWVSNALSCLLSSAGATVDPTAEDYNRTLGAIVAGLGKGRTSSVTCSTGAVRLVHFDNLVWDGTNLTQVPKPTESERFDSFATYKRYLDTKLRMLARNASDSSRARALEFLGTASSGYDSATCAALAAQHGLKQVITFTMAKRNLDDSGEHIASHLGLQCTRINRDAWRGVPRAESLFVSGHGGAMDMLFAGAAPHLSGRVLLTGYHGDKMWSKEPPPGTDIVRGDNSGLSLTEFRLRAGFINCAMPFWGARQIHEVHQISVSDEMRAWDIPGAYSRPICRRILEEAGVPRELFGMRKKAAAQGIAKHKIFLSPSARADYAAWLKAHRSDFVLAGRELPIVSPRLDRMYMELRYFVEQMSTKLLEVVEGRRFVWRLARLPFLKRMTHLTADRPANGVGKSILRWRGYLFPWALERTKADVPSPGLAFRIGRTQSDRSDPVRIGAPASHQ